jgi:hypothetical protein
MKHIAEEVCCPSSVGPRFFSDDFYRTEQVTARSLWRGAWNPLNLPNEPGQEGLGLRHQSASLLLDHGVLHRLLVDKLGVPAWVDPVSELDLRGLHFRSPPNWQREHLVPARLQMTLGNRPHTVRHHGAHPIASLYGRRIQEDDGGLGALSPASPLTIPPGLPTLSAAIPATSPGENPDGE